MKQNINIEAEGNELILKNKAGDYVIIPKKYRLEVQDMIKENCHSCIDKLVETLPVMEDYAQDGSLYPKEPVINPDNPIKLPEVAITAEAPTYIKYRRAWEKENPFDIDKYVEDRFNNPVGREAISRINEKAWKETLKQEGLKKRQSELDEATKMGLLYQRFNPQGKDDIAIADEQFNKRYGTSPHKYRYDNDPEYRKYYENIARNATSKIDYSSTDLRRKGVIAPNNMWMYPNLTGETKQAMTNFSNEVIGMALPIPGLEVMGKIPSVFKAAKNVVKSTDKVVDAIKVGSKVVGKGDDVVKLVERKQVFDKETLDAIDRYNKYFGKNDPNSTLTMADKIKIGRDVVSRKNLEKAYRNTHIEEILDARKKGYFNNEKFPDTDWYYGGSSSKYGNIEIEAVPDSKFFRLFEVDGKYVGIVTPDKEILHLKGTNVPYEGVVIRYKGKELSDDMLERISKIYKKGDNLDEIISKAGNKVNK